MSSSKADRFTSKKMFSRQFYAYLVIYFTSENASFCDNLQYRFIRESRLSQQPPDRVGTVGLYL